MKLKWGLIGILIGILSACQSSNQPMDITYPQPSINIPAEGQKPPIDSEVEIKTPVLESDEMEEPINQTEENEEDGDCLVIATVNQAVELLQLQMSEKQLAAIIHEPTEQQLAIVDHLDVIEYNQEPSDERLLVIPQHIGSKITIYQVRYEDDKLIEGTPLLETQIVEDGQILDIECSLPEGIPHTKIVIEYKENRVDYLITYDGVGTRPQVEFLEDEN